MLIIRLKKKHRENQIEVELCRVLLHSAMKSTSVKDCFSALSLIVPLHQKKTIICICVNKGADQLCGAFIFAKQILKVDKSIIFVTFENFIDFNVFSCLQEK